MANTEQMKILFDAIDNVTKTAKQVKGAVKEVGDEAKKTSAQAKTLTKDMGGAGRSAGQAGIQIQQLVGQITAGTSPMVAFSQQASDLGFVLGVPLLGAVVGIASAIGSVLLPQLFAAQKGFAELSKEAQSLGLGFGQLPSVLTEQEFLRLGTQAGQTGQKLQELQRQMAALDQEMQIASSSTADSADEFGSISRPVKTIQKEIDDLNVEIAKTSLELQIANKRTIDFSDALYGQYIRANEARNSITNFIPVIQEYTNKENDALAALRRRAQGVKESINPMLAYQRELQDLQSMEANGLLTAQEYEDAKKKLVDRFKQIIDPVEKTTTAIDQMNEAFKQAGERGIKTLEDGLVNLINGTTNAKDAFRSMAKSIVDDLIRMQIRASITGPLMRNFGGLFGGAPTNPIPVTDLSSPAGSLPSFAGGGYTGMSGRSGGIDGKGGFPAILHPNETVVDHSQGQSSGGVIINQTVQISTGVAQTVRTEIASLMPQIAAATKQAVVDARRRGGSFASAFGG